MELYWLMADVKVICKEHIFFQSHNSLLLGLAILKLWCWYFPYLISIYDFIHVVFFVFYKVMTTWLINLRSRICISFLNFFFFYYFRLLVDHILCKMNSRVFFPFRFSYLTWFLRFWFVIIFYIHCKCELTSYHRLRVHQ